MKTILLALALSVIGAAQTDDNCNRFGRAYNYWAALANARVAHGGMDAREQQQWIVVKREFHTLEKQMDAVYKGRQ